MKKRLLAIALTALIISGSSLYSQRDYRIVNRFSVPGDGGWDYLNVDEVNGRIFVSHSTVVQAVEINTGKLIRTFPDTKGIHGIAIANDLNKGFTSNGRDSSVTVFNLKTLEVIRKIKVSGQNPDAIIYDSFTRRIFTGNGGSATFSVIDAVNDKEIGVIPLEGKPEAIVTDGKGKIFVNIEDKNLINVVDAGTMKVITHWPINPGEEPSGLALDNQTHLLFSVCRNKLMVVVDAITGNVITTLPIGEGCDGAAFDPVYKRVYASNGEGSLTVVQEQYGNNFKVLETVPTKPGARTLTLNKSSHHIYLTTAEYESAPSGENRRPPIKPGSFVILDIETLR